MTYRDLQWHLAKTFTDEQLDSDVTICQDNGEFFAVLLAFQDGDDVLDDNHPYLAVKPYEDDDDE